MEDRSGQQRRPRDCGPVCRRINSGEFFKDNYNHGFSGGAADILTSPDITPHEMAKAYINAL
jgi:hypothetical protein